MMSLPRQKHGRARTFISVIIISSFPSFLPPPIKVLPTWKVGQSGSLSFRFATNERNGLLFYNGAGGSMASGPMGGGGHGNFGGAMGGGSRKDNGKVSMVV